MYGGQGEYIPEFPLPDKSQQIVIYYLSWCPSCKRALEALRNFRDKKGNPMLYSAYDAEALMTNLLRQTGKKKVDQNDLGGRGRSLFFKHLDGLTGKYRYFPLVFVQGKFIGGSSDLIQALNQLQGHKHVY